MKDSQLNNLIMKELSHFLTDESAQNVGPTHIVI